MTYLELKKNLKDFVVFTPQDIRKNEADFDLRRIYEWQDKGYIKSVRRGYYIFSDLKINEATTFTVANKIYSPSYISFEMGLSYYGLIPEAVYTITSATTKKTYNLQATMGNFAYTKIKPELMFGYKIIKYNTHSFKLAEIEKLILDYFYINSGLKSNDDFEGMRFNIDGILEQIDFEKLKRYLTVFDNKSLTRRIDKFIKYVKS